MRLQQLLALFAFALLLTLPHAEAQSPNASSGLPSAQGISQIDYESSATAILCHRHRIVLDEDGNSTLFTELCRKRTPSDRTTYCQVKRGTVPKPEFEKLMALLQKGGFFRFKRDYELNPDGSFTTEGNDESTRAIRIGNAYEVVSYNENGPPELWAMLRAQSRASPHFLNGTMSTNKRRVPHGKRGRSHRRFVLHMDENPVNPDLHHEVRRFLTPPD